jgi:hypothetical protein
LLGLWPLELCGAAAKAVVIMAITYRIHFANGTCRRTYLCFAGPRLSRRYRSALSIVCSWRSASRLPSVQSTHSHNKPRRARV